MSHLPDEWIQVWFTDNGTACIRHTQEHIDRLHTALELRGVPVVFECLDGAPMVVRASYIGGYIISRPETRIIARAFEKARNKETKAEKSWDDEE